MMMLTLGIKQFSLAIGKYQIAIEPFYGLDGGGIFMKVCKYQLTIQRSDYRPPQFLEVYKEHEGNKRYGYDSPWYYCAGWRLHWTKENEYKLHTPMILELHASGM
jgi:hypothetical protein